MASSDTIRARGDIVDEEFKGREEFLATQLLRLRSEQAKSGVFVNTIVIAGFQRIGRRLFSKHLTKALYPGGRAFGPVIDLPPFADALDLYFGLRETRLAPSDFAEFKRDFKEFEELSDAQKALAIVDELDHYGSINQQVLVRSCGWRRSDG